MSDEPPPESGRSPATEGNQEPGVDGHAGPRDGASPADSGNGEAPADPGAVRDSTDPSGGSEDVGEDGATGGSEHDEPEGEGESGHPTESDRAGADGATGIRSVPWLYLLGVLVFVASLGAFVWDLATGHPIERSLVTNALGTVMLVAWAGYDSYRDPETGVATRGGAVGTGLILVGIYLFVAGLVVAVTSLIHDRTVVGLLMVAGSVPLVLVGFLSYPTEDVLGEREDAAESGTATTATETEGDA
ncbi:MAG: hypothetical protein V5A18_09395 [Haloarculaceae archaeon]